MEKVGDERDQRPAIVSCCIVSCRATVLLRAVLFHPTRWRNEIEKRERERYTITAARVKKLIRTRIGDEERRGTKRVCAARLPGLHWATAPPPTRTARPTNRATATPLGPGRSPSPDNDNRARPCALDREGKRLDSTLLGVAFPAFLVPRAIKGSSGGHVTTSSRGNEGGAQRSRPRPPLTTDTTTASTFDHRYHRRRRRRRRRRR